MPGRRLQESLDRAGFVSLVVFAILLYTVPGEWFEALRPWRLALVSSAAAVIFLGLSRAGPNTSFYFGAGGGCLLAFAGLALASASWSIFPAASRTTGIELLKAAAVYVAMVNLVATPRRLAQIAGALLIASVVPSFEALRAYAMNLNLLEGFRARWVGVYADPNHMAMDLAMVVPLAATFALRREGRGAIRVAAFTAMALATAAVVVSHSRGGFIGLLVGLGIWVALQRRRGRGVALAFVLAVGLVALAPRTFWARNETVAAFREDASAMGRVHAWEVTAKINGDFPLFGVGAGAFRYAWPLYAPPEARRAYVAHNVFLDVLGELGLLGFGLFTAVVALALRGARRASQDRKLGGLAGAILAATVGYLFSAMFSGYLLSSHLFVLLGLAQASSRLADRGEMAAAPVPSAGLA